MAPPLSASLHQAKAYLDFDEVLIDLPPWSTTGWYMGMPGAGDGGSLFFQHSNIPGGVGLTPCSYKIVIVYTRMTKKKRKI